MDTTYHNKNGETRKNKNNRTPYSENPSSNNDMHEDEEVVVTIGLDQLETTQSGNGIIIRREGARKGSRSPEISLDKVASALTGLPSKCAPCNSWRPPSDSVAGTRQEEGEEEEDHVCYCVECNENKGYESNENKGYESNENKGYESNENKGYESNEYDGSIETLDNDVTSGKHRKLGKHTRYESQGRPAERDEGKQRRSGTCHCRRHTSREERSSDNDKGASTCTRTPCPAKSSTHSGARARTPTGKKCICTKKSTESSKCTGVRATASTGKKCICKKRSAESKFLMAEAEQLPEAFVVQPPSAPPEPEPTPLEPTDSETERSMRSRRSVPTEERGEEGVICLSWRTLLFILLLIALAVYMATLLYPNFRTTVGFTKKKCRKCCIKKGFPFLQP